MSTHSMWKQGYTAETTDLSQVTDKMYRLWYTFCHAELVSLLVMDVKYYLYSYSISLLMTLVKDGVSDQVYQFSFLL
jgi:hypothetical protein